MNKEEKIKIKEKVLKEVAQGGTSSSDFEKLKLLFPGLYDIYIKDMGKVVDKTLAEVRKEIKGTDMVVMHRVENEHNVFLKKDVKKAFEEYEEELLNKIGGEE